jgi:hypothetical protein
MKAYSYELIAMVLVLVGSILFSVLGISDHEGTFAGKDAPAGPDAGVVSLR